MSTPELAVHGAAFVAALQLADSALPIGRLVHSNGLAEWLACNPTASDRETEELVRTTVVESVAPLDGVALAHAYRCRSIGELIEIDVFLGAHKLSEPARTASMDCGRRLARLAPNLIVSAPDHLSEFLASVDARSTPGNLAVVEGAVTRAIGITAEEAVLIELRGAASALVSAAVRLGRLGAIPAQAVLSRLAPRLAVEAKQCLEAPLDDIRTFGGELEIAALAHQRNDARLFTT